MLITLEGSDSKTRIIPVPAPAIKPVAPLILSIHPGTGSCHDAVTIEGRTMQTGSPPASLIKICSANAFVYVYVFGRFPAIKMFFESFSTREAELFNPVRPSSKATAP